MASSSPAGAGSPRTDTTNIQYALGTAVVTPGLKPHYMCNLRECRVELEMVHGVQANPDLTVAEMRVLLKAARLRAGMIVAKGKTPDLEEMNKIKDAKLPALKEMCQERGISYGPKPTVGELRVLLRAKVVEAGMSTMEMTIGKHKGKTYQEIMFTDEQYCHWAVKEVAQSTRPDWRLVRFARWCQKTFNDEMESDNDEWTPVAMPPPSSGNTPIKMRAIVSSTGNDGYMTASPGVASGSNCPSSTNNDLDILKKENEQLKEQMAKMEKMMSEVLADKKSKREVTR